MAIERRDLYGVPDNIAEKFEPLLPKINDVLKYQPDFPHQAWHGQAVTRDCVFAAETWGMDKESVELTRLIAENHDEGYRFVAAGILDPRQHHFGSYLIALSKYPDLSVAKGVLVHNQDVLPEESPLPYWLVRDIDRLHLMGWGGVVRASYYLGFRPFNMEGHDPDKIARAASLFENRTPDEEKVKTETRIDYCFPATAREMVLQTDYERRVKRYSWLHVFPFLSSIGRLDELEEGLKKRSMEWLVGDYYDPQEDTTDSKDKDNSGDIVHKIEPIGDMLQIMFGARVFNTYDAEYAIAAWKELHPDGVLKKPKLERRWARETYWHP